MKRTPILQANQTLLVTPGIPFARKSKGMVFNGMSHALLSLMALLFNKRPALNRYLTVKDGPLDFTIGFVTETRSVRLAAVFSNGKMSVSKTIPEDADALLKFKDEAALLEMLRVTPNEVLNLILKNRMILEGNLSYLQLFNFLVSLLMGNKHLKMLQKRHRTDVAERKKTYSGCPAGLAGILKERRRYRMKCPGTDPGVKYLPDPYLSEYSLDDFPRLKAFRDAYFGIKPEICPERAELLTAWCRQNGFETDVGGAPWNPILRQARVFAHIMAKKAPLIRENDLIAGTTTANPTIGVVVYPEAQGTMLWGELGSIAHRILNPYAISEKTVEKLHFDIFPYWAERNFRNWVRVENGYPLCQKIEERWVPYFVWKSVGISHTIPDFPTILKKGTTGIRKEIEARLADTGLSAEGKNTLSAMRIALDGLDAYAKSLGGAAEMQAGSEKDPKQRAQLLRLAEILQNVPANPALTLDEAVNVLNLTWIAVNMENANTGMSFGRLDQWLQPYFETDMEKCATDAEKKVCIKHAVDLIGCLFLRFSDHLPLSPDIGNYLFGGASSTQALTIGGVTPDGRDAVNDMTYIMLKAAEMLTLRDVNVNARHHPEINSETYLKRLCEVNIITAGTPSLHNDRAVFASLSQHGYPEEDIRNWSATGCVEPTISGKHMGHTGAILFNLVAPLEMALHDGCHPLMRWAPGPKTGSIEDDVFPDFESFFAAYEQQLRFLIGQAVDFNNLLAKVHSEKRPTPFLSALMQGTIEKGLDVTAGGAVYNSSGTSNIGLSDVIDSLLVIKQLVYDEKRVPFSRLKAAIDENFENDPALQAQAATRVKKFGSGDPGALEMARRVTALVHDIHREHKNFRGGPYTTGFWSMSQHVAYGSLSGALPSGRVFGKAFTPGLTPHPLASKTFLDNLRDVAALDPDTMDNNIAFNVKFNLDPNDTREKSVETLCAYVKTYFGMGGMQLQFNVVNSETLKDAMAHPENYRHLMVRISGYNAYFTQLNKDIQMELIERAEYAG